MKLPIPSHKHHESVRFYLREKKCYKKTLLFVDHVVLTTKMKDRQ